MNRVILISALMGLVLSCSQEKKSSDHDHNHDQPEKTQNGRRDDLPKARVFRENMKNGIELEPVRKIDWTQAKDAKNMRFHDPIIAFEVDSTFYVIPWYAINANHVANLKVESRDIVVTVCEVCSGSSVFDVWLNGMKKEFRLGGTYNGTIFMLDEANEVWGTFTGEAYTGAQKGERLNRIHSYQSTWKEWLQSGLRDFYVADYPSQYREGHHPNPIIGDREERGWVHNTLVNGEIDPRMDRYEMIQGVQHNGEYRAFTHKSIQEKGVINDTLNGAPIVLFSQPKTTLHSAYQRKLLDQILIFRMEDDQIRDNQTNSLWNFQGRCIEGKLKGEQLAYIENYHEEWYAWAANYPQTTIYTGNN